MKRCYYLLFLFLSLCLFSTLSYALTFQLPKNGANIVGNVFTVFVEPGDSFQEIAYRYDVGYNALRWANPQIKNPNKLRPWTPIIIPNAFVLPPKPQQGIVINLPELRLYYFPSDEPVVMIYPVGVGRPDWETPIIETKVVIKDENPVWTVPKSIKEYMASKGVELPASVAPGPENPLGKYALRLSAWGYLIHGTNQPKSIGRRSSSGCIRMLPQDIAELFAHVPVGTPVRIINQPYKTGWYKNEFYLEAYPPFDDQTQIARNHEHEVERAILTHYHKSKQKLDWQQIQNIASSHVGYPKFISR